MSVEACPYCKANLQGEPIPQEYIDAGMYGDKTHYSRMIGIENPRIYDGILYWKCPDCGGTWHRWPEGTRQHTVAVPYVGEWGD